MRVCVSGVHQRVCWSVHWRGVYSTRVALQRVFRGCFRECVGRCMRGCISGYVRGGVDARRIGKLVD